MSPLVLNHVLGSHLRHIVLAHELVELDILGVLPPLLPVGTVQVAGVCQVLRNRDVSNAGIKPDIEDLLGVLLVAESIKTLGDRNTPLEISGDATGEQTLVDPCLGDGDTVCAPVTLLAALVEPWDEKILNRVQAQVEVLGSPLLGGGTVDLASGVNQPASRLGLNMVVVLVAGLTFRLEGIQKSTTGIALVSASTKVVTDAALSLDETISKELAVGGVGAEWLCSLALLDEAVLPEIRKDLLDNLSLLLGRCSAEDVKVDSEPVVDSLVEGVVLGAQVGGGEALLQGLGLGSGTVLVGTADVDGVVAAGSAVASKNVG